MSLFRPSIVSKRCMSGQIHKMLGIFPPLSSTGIWGQIWAPGGGTWRLSWPGAELAARPPTASNEDLITSRRFILDHLSNISLHYRLTKTLWLLEQASLYPRSDQLEWDFRYALMLPYP